MLEQKVADADLRSLLRTLFGAFTTISDALSKELVVKAEEQKSVFGDVQLGVDVLADDLMWDVCKTEPLIKAGASEEEPEVTESARERWRSTRSSSRHWLGVEKADVFSPGKSHE